MKRSESGSSNLTVFLLFIIIAMAGAWAAPTLVDEFVGSSNKEDKLENLEREIARLEQERDAIKKDLGEGSLDQRIVQLNAKSSLDGEEKQKVPMAPTPPKFAAAKKEGPILRLVRKKEEEAPHEPLEKKKVEVAKVLRGDYEDLREGDD